MHKLTDEHKLIIAFLAAIRLVEQDIRNEQNNGWFDPRLMILSTLKLVFDKMEQGMRKI